MTEPRIVQASSKKLVGTSLKMSLGKNRTPELWKRFMPERSRISNGTGTDLYAVQLYPAGYFRQFDPDLLFEKWAAMEVTDNENIPAGMESLTLPGGLYAVFDYKGEASKGAPFFAYIFGTWIPQSGYVIDDRPHFEVLGAKYKNDDPDSEEELWIPLKKAGQP